MKKQMRILTPLLLGLIVAISVISIRRISDIRDYSKLINYVGIVRGASQRVVKLEMNGHPDDELVGYVEEILNELLTGQGRYGLVLADNEIYRNNLDLLKDQWETVREEIDGVRQGDDSSRLLASSEKLFEIANDTVFSIEQYSMEMAEKTAGMVSVTALVSAIAFAAAVYFYIRKFFQLKVTNERLEGLAYRDELTGAYHMERFYEEVNRIMAQNPDERFAVLYVDFENFKYVNDVFGYFYGDELLKGYAHFVMSRLRDKELLGRDMADRFVILRRYESREELLKTQEQVDEEFLNSSLVKSNRHMMTIAGGICCAEAMVEEPEGLDNEEFVVYMQPKIGVKDGTVKAAEALVRWEVPGEGLLSPGFFIPVLEKNHFIGKVDRYVFEKVCIWFRERMEKGETVVPVSVNVSKIQFYSPDFIPVYAGIKKKYEIPDKMLEIELTESVAFEHEEYLLKIVRELHENGFLCSLDDFGTGYSSLGLLKYLPIDVLKLDGVFFRVSVDVDREQTILKYIINMVKQLHISTVAEGVEREEQVEFLKSVDCDLIQGFVFYRPMPIREFEKVLAANRKEKRQI